MWDVTVKRVTDVTPIPEADAIETIWLGGWPLVTPKNKHKIGDLVIYIPIDSVLPDKLIEEMGLVGRLAGSRKNRVKAVKLRKQLSIGLILPAPPDSVEGESYAERLGIIQYEEVIPPEYAGFAIPKPRGWLKYDVENINNATTWLIEDEEIVILEKSHGTNFACGIVDSEFVVSSSSIVLKESDTNIYWKIARKYDLETKLRSVGINGLWLHGEIFGPIQDLNYGEKDAVLAIFDARTVYENDENVWWDYDPLKDLCKRLELRTVPELYRGPCNILTIKCHSEGWETWSGRNLHIREGCVVKPVVERRSARGDRVLLKIINPAYLLRKGGTELH